ncbi:MAG: efflux transporter outer membrane subunit [Thermodesulfobacteriota bacterium]|nr:efflux transporter outer membrane subunit [Thermodesulfobacteriota bacterium]
MKVSNMNGSDTCHRLRFIRILFIWVALLVVAGCGTVGPDYKSPEMVLPAAWHTPAQNVQTASDVSALAQWWKNFNDPLLSRLIQQAVAANLDLKTALERLTQVRAERTVTRAGLFPSLDTSASTARRRSGNTTRTTYATELDAGWEIDLFGGQRRALEAANADIQSSREAVNDVQVSLTAEVALTYFDLRAVQARLDITTENLSLQTDTFQLVRYRYLAGLDDELSLEQARAAMENTRARLPDLRTAVAEAQNRLAVLLGKQPGRLDDELRDHAPVPQASAAIVVGVPADLLRRRPDIRQAERELAARTARIGVAKSELYPKLTLTGSIGYEALSTDDLFSAGSRFWRYGPGISWPIFQAGAIRAGIKVASSQQKQALLAYEAAVLAALEEVENALAAYGQELDRRQSLEKAADAARKATAMAQNKYDAGLIDFDTLLDAQQTLLSYEDEMVQSRASVGMNLVRLYKAMGGGWTSLAVNNGADGETDGETDNDPEASF